MKVDLPFPNKLLWPNGSRGHPRAVAGSVKRHKADAMWTAKAAKPPILADGLIPIRLTVHARPKGPLPDRDNCIAAAKAYFDGIAAQLGVNDNRFAAPTVEFAEPRNGRFVIEVGL